MAVEVCVRCALHGWMDAYAVLKGYFAARYQAVLVAEVRLVAVTSWDVA
jgi:hypothetical protein